jgi:selenocysteine lyase/cysteine desulfurase
VWERVPTQTGWFADENVFDMQIERYRPHPSARRWDAGTPPVPSIYAGLAGLGPILAAGVEAIHDHVADLAERLVAGCAELGARVVVPEGRGPLVCIRATDAPALVRALAADGIVASERDSSLRVSLHLYNVPEDVDAVLAALARHRRLLA